MCADKQYPRAPSECHSPIHRYMPGIREPTHAVFPRLSPKWSTKASKKMPKEKQTPSTMTLVRRDATTTTQPHPPSGGSGGVTGSSQVSPRSGRRTASSGGLLPVGVSAVILCDGSTLLYGHVSTSAQDAFFK